MFVSVSLSVRLTLLCVALLVSFTAAQVHQLLVHVVQSIAVQTADSIYQLQKCHEDNVSINNKRHCISEKATSWIRFSLF